MNKFVIASNDKYLDRNIQGFYNTDYTRYRNIGNPDYLNDLKNTFGDFAIEKLNKAAQELADVL